MKVEMDKIERLEYRVLLLQKEVDDMKRVISDQTSIMHKMIDLLVETVHHENTAVGYREAYEKIMDQIISRPTAPDTDVHLGKPMKENGR